MIRNRLQAYRKHLGLTQQALADLAGVGESSIRDIESGRHEPTLETALRLADALKVDVKQLFYLE